MTAAVAGRRRQRRVFSRRSPRAESAGARVSPLADPQGVCATHSGSRDQSADGVEFTGVAQTPTLCYAGGQR